VAFAADAEAATSSSPAPRRRRFTVFATLNEMPHAEAPVSAHELATPGDDPRRHFSEALRRPRVAALLVLLCVGAALALRLHNLGDRPFWVDEAATRAFALLDAATLVNVLGPVETTPPTYYLLVKAWMALGDGSEFWLRLPSVLVGGVSVLLFGAFLWRAFGPVPAVWGAALLAVAGGHVRYAQEARVYSLVFMLFVLGLLLMERLAHALDSAAPGARLRRWGFAAGSAVNAGLLIGLHFSATFAAATIYFYGLCLLLARRRASVRRVAVLVASGAAGLVLAAPALLLAFSIAGDKSGAAYWMQAPSLGEAFLHFQSVLWAPQLGRLALPGTALSLLALAVCFWAGRRHPQAVALASAFAFAAGAAYAVSLVTPPMLMGRTVLFTLALNLAILAYGLSRLRRPVLVAAVAAAAFLPQVKGSANQLAAPYFYGEAWVEVARAVNQQAGPRDTVLPVGAFEAVALDHYIAPYGGLRSTAAVGDREGGLFTTSIALMTGAVPINEADLEVPVFCKGLRPGGDVWLLARDSAPLRNLVHRVEQALETAGSTKRSQATHHGLFVERWSPPTRCG